MQSGGGITEWRWKGESHGMSSLAVEVSTKSDIYFGIELDAMPVVHLIGIGSFGPLLTVVDEKIWTNDGRNDPSSTKYAYQFIDGKAVLQSRGSEVPTEVEQIYITRDESVLSQRKDPFHYPELTFLGRAYGQIRIYKNWQFGSVNELRSPQSIDVFPRPLSENYENLGVFLGKLRQNPSTKSRLIECLKDVYEGVTDFELNYEGGTVQLYFHEGARVIPASRLSDGSLRYLCLLAILLDPEPPAFIAIEEPELGMHPDLIPKIADLLVDASTRTQLVVTTHSEMLVEAFHDQPEAIVVCEKHDGQTRMKRLNRDELSIWLKDYRIGDLWMSGQLGGVRW